MNKINKLMEKAAAQGKKAAELLAIANDADKKAHAFARDAERAAADGNVQEYMKFQKKAEEQLAISHVNQTVVEHMESAVTLKEAAEAWKEYEVKQSKVISNLMDKYYESRKALFDLFVEVCEEHRKAFDVRDNLADLVGYDVGDYKRKSEFPLTAYVSGSTELIDDVTFFMRTGIASREKIGEINGARFRG